jgi:hypothetical protein
MLFPWQLFLIKKAATISRNCFLLWAHSDLNQGPSDYEPQLSTFSVVFSCR